MKKILTDEEIKNSIINIISSHLPEAKIILFGSRATGKNRENSDYDISVLWSEEVPVKIYYDIVDELDKLYTLKTIDFVDFYNLDDDFQKFVLEEGVILYDGSFSF